MEEWVIFLPYEASWSCSLHPIPTVSLKGLGGTRVMNGGSDSDTWTKQLGGKPSSLGRTHFCRENIGAKTSSANPKAHNFVGQEFNSAYRSSAITCDWN